jgi:hypothetical protein
MSSLGASGSAFGIVFGASVAGVLLRRGLPRHHLDDASRDVIKLVLGIIATMSALVLGLLVASGKASYDTQQSELFEMTTKLVEIDRVLAQYGPQASGARALLRQAVVQELEQVEPLLHSDPGKLLQPRGSLGHVQAFYGSIQELSPESGAQRYAQTRALELVGSLSELRHLMAQQLSSPIPGPFLAVLIVWLAILFGGFGLFAPANATVLVALLLGALSVAGAIFLVMELGRPHDGIMRISHAPLRAALVQLGR